ncbi:MAG: type II toxin-antitoxin system death-on-curing family toxin [Oscillospiraceae bacterium]|nr:type II toxin-antitoxin system death-on-curing family toxin [Oscillospiraceae bacterium]
MIILSKNEVLKLHKMVIDDIGGAHGLRDDGLLESALNAPFASYGGVDFFPTLFEKAACLAHGLIGNHPFVDGNKRIGILSMQVMLYKNGFILTCSNDELAKLGLGLAKGETDIPAVHEWLKLNTIAQ